MIYLKDVTTLRLDTTACTGCGRCAEVCARAVFEMRERKSVIIKPDACIECGACAKNCAYGAITVTSGVGCAAAFINGMLTGNAPECGCGPKGSSGCC
ncbi:MAG: 4Fe-4S dicluster domain-containing protein [Deltaproteobacteria bacterium]|nr:4Fe-4S dicluster domain-containing protein [Deltaproteobacteria bacterium]